MKNFKLLLASTAILSTGALMANADLSGLSDSADLIVKAEIIKTLNINVDRNLDFGRIAWDYGATWGTNEQQVYIEPNSSGTYTPDYANVAFHDGGETAKICFTDLVPEFELGTDIGIEIDDLLITNDQEDEIGKVTFYPAVDAGPSGDGTRCAYIGGVLTFNPIQAAKNFSGKIEETTTVTVLYDSVNN